ncbi:MAG TPA: TonB-dependent receptor plug domain-containing protein, partial [Flavobacteriaceae bacterium]|nr:TonB-dependent receptor plug domain-containing protein [Flavobacteriaceae bacterium]
MKPLKYILTLLFFTQLGFAQNVKVIDLDMHLPIENVTIYNDAQNHVVYTNKDGIADLSEFKDFDILSFNHLSFNEYDILKKDLAVLEYTVYLSRKAEMLDEIVLSASKSQEKRSRIAEQIAVVSAADIQKLAPQTSADLLANIPSVRVQKSQFGGGSPVLRGMEANRVLLVVDGVRMNNAIYRTGHLQNSITVSPTVLERTEVVFGPSSVIYGSDALGGVIHYYTKTPKLSENREFEASLFSRYSTVNNEITTSADVE